MNPKVVRHILWLISFGSVMQFGGCLGSGLARDIILDQTLDLITGNNTVLDFFTNLGVM